MKTAIEMIDTRDTIIELETSEVVEQGTGFNLIKGWKFFSRTLYVIRMIKNNATSIQITYFNDKDLAQRSAIVPNEFKMKLAEPSDKTKAVIEKYQQHVMLNMIGELNEGFTLGADPEVFVETEGELLPAFAFLGSKAKPTKAEKTSRGYYNNIYWDGFQAEFDVQANTCAAFVIDSIHDGLKGLISAARKTNPKAKLSSKTVFDIPEEMLKKSAPEHVAFGCMPSLNVYGMSGLQMPGEQVTHRASGGHVHFGVSWKKDEIERAIKSLDAILGVAGVSLFANYDDPRRRVMYGLAGEYRTPKHGFEYRVLSNAWMFHPLMANIVYDLARPAAVVGKRNLLHFWKGSEEETIKCINDCDAKLAREILTRNKDMMLRVLSVKMGPDRAKFIFEVIMNGMESVVLNPDDIETNWCLTNNRWQTHCESSGKNINRAYELVLDGVKKV